LTLGYIAPKLQEKLRAESAGKMIGGGEWELNPPAAIKRLNGFEDREGHRASVTSEEDFTANIKYKQNLLTSIHMQNVISCNLQLCFCISCLSRSHDCGSQSSGDGKP
jgi:hypothetical protein